MFDCFCYTDPGGVYMVPVFRLLPPPTTGENKKGIGKIFQKTKRGSKEDMSKRECCGTCKHVEYDKEDGYICMNEESEYESDYTEYGFVCEEYEAI